MVSASIGYQCPDCAQEKTLVIRNPVRNRFVPSNKKAKVTKFLSISLVVIFLLQSIPGLLLIDNFALFAPAVSNGQWWRLITAGFLHGSIIHLFFNVYILWMIGSQLENLLSSLKFSVIYFISLLGGSIVSYLFSPFGSYSIGASGAIFGLMGAMLIVGRKKGLDISQISTLLVLNVVLGFIISGIDWRAHLGGLIAGVITSYFIINATSLTNKNRRG
jgi:membrane associated rhomboid family serine protease